MDPAEKKHSIPKESLLFWVVSYILFAICFCNILLTFYLLNIFEIGKGMKYIEVTDGATTNFYENVDFGNLIKLDGVLESFSEPLIFTNENNNLKIDLVSRILTKHNKLSQNAEGTNIRNINYLDLKSNNGDTLFDVQKPSFFLEKPSSSIISSVLHVNGRITGSVGEKLLVTAKNNLSVKGNEGTNVEAQDIFVIADKDLNLISQNLSVNLLVLNEIYLDINRLPTADIENGLRKAHVQYKICVCYPSGELFRNHAKGREPSCIVTKYNNPCG